MAVAHLLFTKKKETKNTIQYEEVERPGQPIVIGSLYVQKHFAGDAVKVSVVIDNNPKEGK